MARPHRQVNPGWRDEQRVCRRCFGCSPPLAHVGELGRARPLFHEEGALDADVLFVMEAPNHGDTFEPDKGRLTIEVETDPTGALLAELLESELELTPDDVLFVNAVLCLPAGSNGKYPVTSAIRRACAPHLRTTIEEVDPTVVVALGSAALAALNDLERHGLSGITKVAGKPVPWMGRTLLPLVHTSRQGRLNRPVETMREDWRVLKSLLVSCTEERTRHG